MLYSLGLVLGHLIRLMKSLFLFEDGCHTLVTIDGNSTSSLKLMLNIMKSTISWVTIFKGYYLLILTLIINFPQFIFARRFHFKLILLQHLQNGQDVKLYLKSQKRWAFWSSYKRTSYSQSDSSIIIESTTPTLIRKSIVSHNTQMSIIWIKKLASLYITY